jgi:hypothetical protein
MVQGPGTGSLPDWPCAQTRPGCMLMRPQITGLVRLQHATGMALCTVQKDRDTSFSADAGAEKTQTRRGELRCRPEACEHLWTPSRHASRLGAVDRLLTTDVLWTRLPRAGASVPVAPPLHLRTAHTCPHALGANFSAAACCRVSVNRVWDGRLRTAPSSEQSP